MKTTLLLVLLLSNLFWFTLYSSNDRAYMQEEGLRAEADSILRQLPDGLVYQLYKTADGELKVHCLNGGDATIRPVEQFGEIIVSCGK